MNGIEPNFQTLLGCDFVDFKIEVGRGHYEGFQHVPIHP